MPSEFTDSHRIFNIYNFSNNVTNFTQLFAEELIDVLTLRRQQPAFPLDLLPRLVSGYPSYQQGRLHMCCYPANIVSRHYLYFQQTSSRACIQKSELCEEHRGGPYRDS